MKNNFMNSFYIELTYSINSFFYTLRKVPIFRDLITEDVYADEHLKTKLRFVCLLYKIFKKVVGKIIYSFIILGICYKFFPNNKVQSFFHIYFVFTIIGLFLQNQLLNPSTRKYYSLILFDMDDTLYFRMMFIWNQIENLFLNCICFIILYVVYQIPFSFLVVGVLLPFFARIIGEAFSIIYYQKYHYLWYSNTKLYFLILGSLLAFAALPFLDIFIPGTFMIITFFIFMIGSVPSCIYLWRVNCYKAMYKKIHEQVKIMNSDYKNDYMKQMMVDIKKGNQKISPKKLEGKFGLDRFQVIFFERHKEILTGSLKTISFFLVVFYVVIIVCWLNHVDFSKTVVSYYQNHFSYFILVMFFINRGPIVTQAMFYNCDHAMLRYNFYREEQIIMSLFYKRLKMVILINLLPAFIIGLGNLVIDFLLKYSILSMGIHFFFIMILAVLLSIHYLSLYYLFQPYNQNLETKRIDYHLVNIITFIVINYFSFSKLITDSGMIVLSIILILYIIALLFFVKKYAIETFRIQ